MEYYYYFICNKIKDERLRDVKSINSIIPT